MRQSHSKPSAEERQGELLPSPIKRGSISLLVFDFDGVLTDNRVGVLEDGREFVICNRSDGLAFDLFRAASIPVLILSTERNPVVAARAKKLGVEVIHGVGRKLAALKQYCAASAQAPGGILYAGNDVNDLSVMRWCGWPVCPADAHPSVQRVSRIVLKAIGGGGVAREIAERLLGLHYRES